MKILITNISKLLQVYDMDKTITTVSGKAMQHIPCIDNAWLLIDNKTIHSFGTMQDLNVEQQVDTTIDAKGGLVLPTWIDSHTHLVFATTREKEFEDRIKGVSYEEIAAKGGGILNSAAKLQAMPEELLYAQSLEKLLQVIEMGTGAIEIKSGYGLTVEAELKMLRVIRKLKEQNIIPIKATFLGAHAYPLAYKQNHEAYIDILIKEMLPKIADENLADYIDVFCEKGFFNVDETSRILDAGAKYNLKPKIHANQLHNSGGIQVGVQHKAISVDHLETLGDVEIACLQSSKTIPTLLPGAAFFLGMHYQPARLLLDAGLPVCLASDYNPGSCPSANMNFVISLACTQMKMTPAEAIHACTINAAAALELSSQLGVIQVGKKANVMITKPMQNEALIPYSFGENVIKKVIV